MVVLLIVCTRLLDHLIYFFFVLFTAVHLKFFKKRRSYTLHSRTFSVFRARSARIEFSNQAKTERKRVFSEHIHLGKTGNLITMIVMRPFQTFLFESWMVNDQWLTVFPSPVVFYHFFLSLNLKIHRTPVGRRGTSLFRYTTFTCSQTFKHLFVVLHLKLE